MLGPRALASSTTGSVRAAAWTLRLDGPAPTDLVQDEVTRFVPVPRLTVQGVPNRSTHMPSGPSPGVWSQVERPGAARLTASARHGWPATRDAVRVGARQTKADSSGRASRALLRMLFGIDSVAEVVSSSVSSCLVFREADSGRRHERCSRRRRQGARTPDTTRLGRLMRLVPVMLAGALQLVVGFFTITAIGLVGVPLWAAAGLAVLWIAAALLLVRLRRKPLAVLLVPVVNALLLWATISAGEAWLGWTA